MSLIFIEGFDHYATADLLKKWDYVYNATIVAGSGRRGGKCLDTVSSQDRSVGRNLTAYASALIAGFAAKYSGTDDCGAFHFKEGTTKCCYLVFHPDGRVQIKRGASTVVATSLPGVLPIAAWCYVEIKAVFGATTGAVEVRINGNTVISATNVNTADAGTLGYSNFILGKAASTSFSAGCLLDDLYVLDTSGASNNDFLGDCRVDAYLPTSEGDTQAWDPTPAGTHYTTVDDATPSATDYVSSNVAGEVELFGFTDMVNTPLAVFGVQLASSIFKTDAGFRAVKGLVRLAATNYPSSEISVTETERYALAVWDQDPNAAAAWTRTTVNDAQFGVELV